MKQSLTDDFVSFYQAFSADSIANLGHLYAESITFVDPVHKVNGLESLKQYFHHLCGGEGTSHFAITDVIAADKELVLEDAEAQASAFFRWQMTYNHPSLSSGKPLILVGGSMIRFSNRITYQEDFYDLGQMVYQHIPVLGWAVKKVKARLAGSEAIAPSPNNTATILSEPN